MSTPAVPERRHFQQQLAELERHALGGLDLVIEQLERYLEVHQGILSLLALQAPVAGDLRLVAALLHVIKHVERMGDQCVNVAKLIPLSGHEPPRRDEILEKLIQMGRFSRSEVAQAKQAFA